jgi:hypothetical protein
VKALMRGTAHGGLQPNKRMQLAGASLLRNVRLCPNGQVAAADARSVRQQPE